MSKKLPQGWKKVKLSKIANISAGQGAPQKEEHYGEEGLPFIKAGNLEELCKVNNEDKLKKVSELVAINHKLKVFEKGTVVFAKSGMSCTKNRVYMLKQDCYVVNHLACIICIDKEIIDSRYLTYLFRNNPPSRLIIDESYPSIRLSDIGDMKIILPPLEEQERIVSILERAESAIQKRKESSMLLDELVKSKFIEMFGDPVTNPKGWEKGRISDIIVKTQYGTSTKADEHNGEFKVLRMNNITYCGNWNFSSMKYVDLNEKDKEKYLVYKGEVLFNRTNSKELVGKTAVYKEDEPMAYAGYLVRAIPNERATGEFISAYMNTKYVKAKLFSMAKNIVGMANINAEEFKKIDVYIPPIELQNDYTQFVEQVDKLKLNMENSLKELENNFNSLMQRAFKGEL